MKKAFVTAAIMLSMAVGSDICAQEAPPPGAGDKGLRDTNVKSRSAELERIDREARKNDKSGASPATANAEDRLAAKYDEIKADFEQIQTSQDAVVKTYQGSGKIDYAQIGKSALEINKSAVRLNSNLFPAPPENPEAKAENEDAEKKERKAAQEEKKTAKSLRDLIIELDNAVGSFATSPMFQNLRTVDAAFSAKAKLDLEKIIELSALLGAEAQKSATGGN